MGVLFRLPNINGINDTERIAQIRSYLFQLAEQLQLAFNEIPSENELDSHNKEVAPIDKHLMSRGSVTKYGVKWYYRKWYDGTAECWASRTINIDVTAQWGSMYSGAVPATTLPFTFYETPVCHISVNSPTHNFFVVSSNSPTMVSTQGVALVSLTQGTGVNVNVLYSVHGRWK